MYYSLITASLTPVAESSSHLEWWQTTTGIIGIPTAILAIFASWFLITKTRLESRKLQLEIREKEQALADARTADDPIRAAEIVAEPTFQVRRDQDIILRAILLFLVLSCWRLFEFIFSDLSLGPHIAALSFADIVSIVYWLVFVAMGWPLLLDTLQVLRVNTPDFLRGRTAQWLVVLLVALFLLVSINRRELLSGF